MGQSGMDSTTATRASNGRDELPDLQVAVKTYPLVVILKNPGHPFNIVSCDPVDDIS